MLIDAVDVETIKLSPTRDFVTITGKLADGTEISFSGNLVEKINPSETLPHILDLKRWSSLIIRCEQNQEGKVEEIFMYFIDRKPLDPEDIAILDGIFDEFESEKEV